MNTMTKYIFVALALVSLSSVRSPALAAFKAGHAGGEMSEDCLTEAKAQAAKKAYEQVLADDKAGRTKQAYDGVLRVNGNCIVGGDRNTGRLAPEEERLTAIRRKSGLKLGGEAENKGRLAEAYQYYNENFHGIPADRVQMKLATAKAGDFKAVQGGINYFRDKQKYLNEYLPKNTGDGRARLNARHGYSPTDVAWALDPNRDARLKAIGGYLGELKAIATKQGEKFLADEDKVFNARKTTMMAKGDTLAELNKARDWFGLFGQEKFANDRAVKRGDTLLADDSRKSLRLAISYYSFPIDDFREKRAQKVKDKAHRLGDAHLKKGEKQIAADYYHLAGLGDKASKLEESHEAEKEKAETKRQDKFKKDQQSLEKELGL